VILFPSLALLFRLFLGGQFDPGEADERPAAAPARGMPAAGAVIARAAGACLIAGVLLLVLADAPWTHAVGVVCLMGFVLLGFVAVGPAELSR
jgi:cytochrome bd ubiquinol oxidase subunit II